MLIDVVLTLKHRQCVLVQTEGCLGNGSASRRTLKIRGGIKGLPKGFFDVYTLVCLLLVWYNTLLLSAE